MKAKNLPWEMIELCRDGQDAIQLCLNMRTCKDKSGRKLSQNKVGEILGIDKGHFSKIMSGTGYFPDHKRTALMELCGNRAPYQFEQLWAGDGPTEQRNDERNATGNASSSQKQAIEFREAS